jgi:hypothetical protein
VDKADNGDIIIVTVGSPSLDSGRYPKSSAGFVYLSVWLSPAGRPAQYYLVLSIYQKMSVFMSGRQLLATGQLQVGKRFTVHESLSILRVGVEKNRDGSEKKDGCKVEELVLLEG